MLPDAAHISVLTPIAAFGRLRKSLRGQPDADCTSERSAMIGNKT